MKKILLIIFGLLLIFGLSSCQSNTSDKDDDNIEDKDDEDDDDDDDDDDEEEPGLTLEDFTKLVDEDAVTIQDKLNSDPYKLDLPTSGTKSQSAISWEYDKKYVNNKNMVAPLIGDDDFLLITLTGTFKRDDLEVTKDFEFNIIKDNNVVLSDKRTLEFTNLTEEYIIEDTTIDIFYEKNGAVPFVKIMDFLELLRGLVSEDTEFYYEVNGDEVTIGYPYIDEDGVLFDLKLVIDTVENTLYSEDPGFYYAYIESTETNYSRNIEYADDHPLSHFDEGHGIFLDLDRYSMDIVVYEDEVVIPFYIANQLFAGSSYYTVYYNYDKLSGVYSVPSENDGDGAYQAIKQSTKNNRNLTVDLVRHNFSYFAFVLDYYYGLKEIKEVDSYYDLLLGGKDELLSVTASSVDKGIFNFIYGTLDDLHTSFGFGGYYLNSNNAGPQVTSINQFGPRVASFYLNGLYAIDTKIATKWGITTSSWAADDPKRPMYWYADEDKTTAVISLDGFSTVDILECEVLDETYVKEKLGLEVLPFQTTGNYYYIMDFSFDQSKNVTVVSRNVAKADYESFLLSLVSSGYTLNSEYDAYVKESLAINCLYDETVNMLFVTYAFEPKVEDSLKALPTDIFDVVLSDSALYMEYVLRLIKAEAPECKNMLLDLTFNTGGNIGALYRVVGFVTNEVFLTSKQDPLSQQKYTSAVYVNSPYYDETLNWGLLVSPVTFSAANELVAIFRSNNLGFVAGIKTSGGASSITPIALPNGSMILISSNNIMSIRTGTDTEEDPYVYNSTELGLTPDIEIPLNELYSNEVILDLFN